MICSPPAIEGTWNANFAVPGESTVPTEKMRQTPELPVSVQPQPVKLKDKGHGSKHRTMEL